MSAAPTLRIGTFELDRGRGELRQDGRALPLRPRPFALLEVLATRAGEVFTKDELLSAAWPGVIVEENNLQVQVSVLRKLLGAGAIATFPGRGYRLDLPVEPLTGDPSLKPEELAGAGSALHGRDADLQTLQSCMRESPLVTITGPGGIGKTRLAQAGVATAAGALKDGAHWVDLAHVNDAALLWSELLQLTGLNAKAGADAQASVLAWLAERQVLLVLDNAEHLVEGVAALAATVLRQSRGVRLLVTSQLPLRLAAERQLRLGPLPVPMPDATTQEAAGCASVALFLERARAGGARLSLDQEALGLVAEICRRLNGMPLALELAAARVPAFGVRGVATLLDEPLRLLSAGGRDAPERHRTLEAVYDWTYGLLDAREQAFFRRLGVVGAPLALQDIVALSMATQAAPDEWSAYDLLASLVERSLVQMDDRDPPRYSLLESARAYALSRLQSAGEQDVFARASAWYEAWGDRAAEAVSGYQALAAYGAALDLVRFMREGAAREQRELTLLLKLGPAVQATLGPAHPRCEAIYRRSVELARNGPPGETAFQALWGYWHFLSLAGRDRDARPYAREIVEMAPQLQDDGLQLEALHAAMTTCDLLGDAAGVVAHARRINGMYDRCRHHRLTFAFGGHDPGVCALGQGAVNLWLCGQPEEARTMANQALELAAQIEHGYSRATAAFYAAIVYASLGDQPLLERTADHLVSLSSQYGIEMLLTEGRFFQGRALYERGDREGIVRMREALASIEASQDLAFVFVYMALLADALLATGDIAGVHALAQRALGHAALGQRLFLPEVLRLRALARAQAGDPRWAQDLADGLAMAKDGGAAALAGRIEEAKGLCEAFTPALPPAA